MNNVGFNSAERFFSCDNKKWLEGDKKDILLIGHDGFNSGSKQVITKSNNNSK